MGTNYYFEPEGETTPCCECGQDRPVRKHIGKRSAGWVFLLHIYPSEHIEELTGWKIYWNNHPGRIVNEYGERLTHDELEGIILNGCPMSGQGVRPLLRQPVHFENITRPGLPYDCLIGDFT